jgi:DNA-binding SARP family transcriptional activator
LAAGKQRLLLAALAFRPSQVVSVDRLIDDLWGDAPPAQADKTLRAHVSHLRALLQGDDVRSVLVARRPGYVLEIDGEELDAARFRSLAGEGRAARADGDQVRAAALLSEALGLWRGDAAAGCDLGPDLASRVVVLAEERLAALEDRLEADLALGRHARVIGELEALVAAHPLRERLRQLQMLALYRSGRQAEALRAYQVARDALVEDLGIEPGAELRDLEAAILRQDPDLVARTPEAATTTPIAPAAAVDSPARRAGSPFVGRVAELDVLGRALTEAMEGTGRLAVVRGEGGAGKTRLLEEVRALASGGGAQVLVGRCDETGGAPPFWPWMQALRDYMAGRTPERVAEEAGDHAGAVVQLVPELATRLPNFEAPPTLEAEAARFRLFDAVANLLVRAARATPLVLVLEDVHWADTSSVQLLEFLGRRIGGASILVVAAWRPDHLEARSPITTALRGVTTLPLTVTVDLSGLDSDEVAQLLEVSMGAPVPVALAARVCERTQGNPLFVVELARVAVSEQRPIESMLGDGVPLPGGIRALVLARAERLSAAGRRVLDLAAVAGHRFTLAELQRSEVVPRADLLEGLDELLGTGTVDPVEGSATAYVFHHEVVREAVYDSLGWRQRAALHRGVAGALEALDPTGGRLEELAHHYMSAAAGGGDVEPAVRYALRVGERAERALAYSEAARRYERALELAELLPAAGDRAELLLRLGRARFHAGDTAASRQAFEAAAAIGRTGRQPDVVAAAALGVGLAGVTNGVVDDGLVALLEEALTRLPPGDHALRARLLARLATEQYFTPATERSAEVAEDSVERARRSGDLRALSESLSALHFCLRRPGRLDARLAVGAELLELAERSGAPELVLRARHARIGDFVECGDVAAFVEELGAYSGLADEVGEPRYRAHAAAWRALLRLLEGDLDEAERLATVAFDLGAPSQPDMFLQIYATQTGLIRWFQGRSGEVADVVRPFVEQYPAAPAWRCALVLFDAETGDLEAARAGLAQLSTGGFASIPLDANWHAAMAVLAMACSHLGAAGHAAALYDLLAAHPDGHVVVGGVAASATYGSVALYLGLLAETAGRPKEAAVHLEAAIEANAALGSPAWLAHSEASLGRLLWASDDAGERQRATSLRSRAQVTARRLGLANLRQ